MARAQARRTPKPTRTRVPTTKATHAAKPLSVRQRGIEYALKVQKVRNRAFEKRQAKRVAAGVVAPSTSAGLASDRPTAPRGIAHKRASETALPAAPSKKPRAAAEKKPKRRAGAAPAPQTEETTPRPSRHSLDFAPDDHVSVAGSPAATDAPRASASLSTMASPLHWREELARSFAASSPAFPRSSFESFLASASSSPIVDVLDIQLSPLVAAAPPSTAAAASDAEEAPDGHLMGLIPEHAMPLTDQDINEFLAIDSESAAPPSAAPSDLAMEPLWPTRDSVDDILQLLVAHEDDGEVHVDRPTTPSTIAADDDTSGIWSVESP